MQDEEPFHERHKMHLKLVSICCGLLLFALAADTFGKLFVRSPTDIILPIYYVVFSVFMISAEFGMSCILNYFRFIEGFRGRGLFYMFVGTLCLRTQLLMSVVVACVIFTAGVLYLFCFWNVKKPNRRHPHLDLDQLDNDPED